MVLSSQTPRAGSSRQYMSSRPRQGVKWRWVAAIAIGFLSMYFFVWAGDDQAPSADSSASTPSSAKAANAYTPGSQAAPVAEPKSTNDLPPARELGSTTPTAQDSSAVVETIRLGDVTPKPRTTHSTPPRQTPTPAVTDSRPPNTRATSTAQAGSQLARGMSMIREGRLVQGRKELSQLLVDDNASLSPLDAQTVRDTLASVNKHLVFSDEVTPGDPIAESYLVQSGEYLSRIAPKYHVPYQFLELINRTPASKLQAGKPIKVIKGPFYARISKSNYRMDIFVNDPDGQPLYIRSFTVGLGKTDSTPQGAFIVAPNSKVENPSWRNPRTGEFFGQNDPENPIGEYWLALKGTDAETEAITGYGIHGTTDPTSIGRQASMGCVRLADKDIKLIYQMFEGGQSTVQINW